MTHNTSSDENPVATSWKKRPVFSITGFGLACLCFFLPFCILTCGDNRIDQKSYSGVDIILADYSDENPEFAQANLITTAAFAFLLAGLILSFFSRTFLLRSIAGSVAVIFLMFLYVYLRDRVKYSSHEAAAFLEVKFRIGYFLALFFSLLCVVLNFTVYREEAEKKKAGS